MAAAPLGAQAPVGWLRAPVPTPPLFGARLVYDAARQRVVLLQKGNTLLPNVHTDTVWEWDGRSWVLRRTTVEPPYRIEHGAAFDRERSRLVVFGGWYHSSLNVFDDTWEWDGLQWHAQPTPQRPPARRRHAMAFDEASRRILMFGGEGTSGLLADTWEYDGTTWVQRFPTAAPSPRKTHAMAHDRARGRTVLFGGVSPPDTWEWDGTTWSARPVSQGPEGLPDTVLTYDSSRQTVLTIGWSSSSLTWLWEWNGVAWTNLGTCPYGLLAYDESRQRLVIGSTFTLEWDGSALQNPVNPWPPQFEAHPVVVYEASRGRLLAHGGWYNYNPVFSPNVSLSGTYAFDGSGWRRVAEGPVRGEHCMAFDSTRGEVVLFGGAHGNTRPTDTWIWDGSQWQQRLPAVHPGPMTGHAMVDERARGRVLLYGNGETWEWDGASWLQRQPTRSPGLLFGHAMAYDARRQRTVLFGGAGAATWEWDGNDWWRLAPARAPSFRTGAAMVFDETRGLTVLIGGTATPDVWSWDGTNWTDESAGIPESMHDVRAAYDPDRGIVYVLRSTHWFYGALLAARADAMGSSCAGGPRPARLTGNTPHLGNPVFAPSLQDAPPGSPCLLGIAARAQPIALPCGCTLQVALPAVVLGAIADAGGHAEWTFAIPNVAALRGATAVVQAAVVDAQHACGGMALTGAVRFLLGD